VTRRAWAVVILAAWAGALAWLVKREVFRPTGARLADAALRVSPGAVYYRLTLGGRQVGFASSTIDTVPAGIAVTDVLVLETPGAGARSRTAAMSRAALSRSLRLERVDVRFEGASGAFAAQASVSGDTVLAVRVQAPTATHTARLRLQGAVVVPMMVPLRLALGGAPKPGRSYAAQVFDPFLLARRDVTVRVTAESTLVVADSAGYDSTAMAWVPAHLDSVRAFGIEETAGGATVRRWIDGQGRVVRAEAPGGLTMERTAFELAFENFRRRDTAGTAATAGQAGGPGAVVATTALAAGARLAPDTTSLVRVRVGGVALDRLELGGGRQELVADTLVVRREGPAALAARYRLPAPAPAAESGPGPALALFLEPDLLAQSDDPRVQGQARAIVGDERRPARAAALLARWVHDHVARRAGAGPPSAVHVLATRRGDCNEQTILYVALARAVGLPARPVAGLLRAEGRFYYHAWPEVYLGDWVAVDPMLDEFPADAAHLRVAVGALARRVELVPLIGRVTLEGL
jgi:hypothetical protein